MVAGSKSAKSRDKTAVRRRDYVYDDDDDGDDVIDQMDPIRGECRGRRWKMVEAARGNAVSARFVWTASRPEYWHCHVRCRGC